MTECDCLNDTCIIFGVHPMGRPKGTKTTMSQIKQANQAIEHHFFEPATLRFFNSRVGSIVYEGENGRLFFVTSEQCSDDHPRLYTLREALPDGSVETVGDFQGHESAAAAQQAIPKSEE